MSEPTISPVGYRCPKCLHMAYERLTMPGPWTHCAFCDVDTEAMFGPDALVAAVMEGFGISSDGHKRSVAEAIVERLTGVKR